MARRKQAVPLRREPSDLVQGPPESPYQESRSSQKDVLAGKNPMANGKANTGDLPPSVVDQGGPLQLCICAGGIYATFLTWAILQEKITTEPYGPPSAPSRWAYSIFLNTMQSTFAVISGYLYFLFSNRTAASLPPLFPSRSITYPLVLVAITGSLAAPFGYKALAYTDYITYILAKSCKLLPVILLQRTIFRKKYPLYKYLVVALVTSGVAVFTVYSTSSKKKSSSTNSMWGLLLLSINLLFDGVTNSTQDHIFQNNRSYSGPQMMVAQNLLMTIFSISYLTTAPYLPALLAPAPNELSSAISFIQNHPSVGIDILNFCLCGAIGQLFIYYTLSQFSSLLLVTTTVTRKMFTMILSVVWFGHSLGRMQWLGVAFVFGGVGAEGMINRREKIAKGKAKRDKINGHIE